jgi:hypothetical protein
MYSDIIIYITSIKLVYVIIYSVDIVKKKM